MASSCTKSTVRFLLFAWAAVALSSGLQGAPKKPKSPFPIYPQHYEAVKAAIAGTAGAKAAITAIDTDLSELITSKVEPNRLKALLFLRGAAETLSGARDREMALWLFSKPDVCGRFLHALDAKDDLDGALGVLKALRDLDPRRFERWSEFCIAYAVVWDRFRGHWWVDRREKMEQDTMLATYKFYVANRNRLTYDPGKLPFEVSIFIVGTRLRGTERGWVSKLYNKKNLNPGAIYKSVPWTQKLSPAHGKGDDVEYTLMNIKREGGVCMEQAYFTENVLRLFGVPAVYTHGRGLRGGHAWVGALMPKPRVHWDFSFGRYRFDRYYKGELTDPTDPSSSIPDSVVKMSAAAMMSAGSISKADMSYYYLQAAQWAEVHLPSTLENRADIITGLLQHSLKITPYNAATWTYLSHLASEKKMPREQAVFWAGKLVELTVKDFPDFTVECLDNFLASVDDPKRKAAIYKKTFNLMMARRPDLACDIKVSEGDLWVAQGDVRRAVLAYAYPLVNLSKDKHILDKAQQRIDELDKKVDQKQLEATYVQLVKRAMSIAPRKQTPELRGFRDLMLRKLIDIAEQRNDKKAAARYQALLNRS
ncbi:MAG: hypothetical protein QGD94_05965 [Planctomycetia bacterium]|nr:hypothetical protein [Planctomycetia bacterium]